MSLLHFLGAMTYLCVTNAINKKLNYWNIILINQGHLKMKLQETEKKYSSIFIVTNVTWSPDLKKDI